MKKVLFISYYFPPYAGGGVYRLLKFVKYLPNYGWEPIVIASSPKKNYWAFDYSLLKEIPAGIKLHKTFSFEPYYFFALLDKLNFSGLKRSIQKNLIIPDDKIGWIPNTLLKALQIIKKESIDVIYTSSPPQSSHILGCILKKLTNLPWVADFRDQWTLNPLYVKSSRLAHKINSTLENKVYLLADKIIHVTDTKRIKNFRKFDVYPGKVSWIPNGYDRDDFQDESIAENKDQFILGYFGNIYGGRENAVEAFLKGADLAIQKDARLAKLLKIEFYGNPAVDLIKSGTPNLKKYFRQNSFIPHVEAIKKMIQTNILLFFLGKGDTNVITAKLFDYIACGKPILALIPDGEAKQILQLSGLGFFSDSWNPEKICDQILDLFAREQNKKLIIEPDWKFIEQFDRKKLTQKLADVFRAVSDDQPCKN